MNIKLYIVDKLMPFIPSSRFYYFKSWLLRWAGFNVHPTARISSSIRICSSIIDLKIGCDTFIGHEVMISGGRSRVTIGNHVDLGPRVSLISSTHEIDMEGKHSAGRGYSLDIEIGDGVWVGTNATIIGGVSIGNKSVIAAGSTVVHSIPPYVLAAGTPCKPIKEWDEIQKKMVPL